MRMSLLVLAVAGCSGMPRNHERVAVVVERGVDGFIAAVRTGDVKAIEQHFADKLVFGGMWFPDEECRRVFPGPGVVNAEARGTLAKCLAQLKLAKGEREHFYPEIVTMTYEPGLEIEAQLGPRGAGAEIEIRWIGHVSRNGVEDGLPTISQRALEQLHGGPLAVDEAARAKLDAELAAVQVRPQHGNVPAVFAWLKVCLDADGKVTDVQRRSTSTLATHDVYAAAARGWTFQPFKLGDQPVPVCSLVHLAHPKPVESAQAKMPVVGTSLPPAYRGAVIMDASARRPVVGERGIVPEDLDKVRVEQSDVKRLMGTFLVCADESGAVDHVGIVRPTGLPSYDRRIVEGIRKWRYEVLKLPDGSPSKACTMVTFIYSQD